MIQIQKMRLERGLTQKALATKAGVALNTVMRMENGQSPGSKMTRARVALALGLDIEDADVLIQPVKGAGDLEVQA